MKTYGADARDYLRRARNRLQEAAPECLFYAAFELRCFVEARQNEYLVSQKEYMRSLPDAWQTSRQWKALDTHFDSGKIQLLQHRFPDGFTFDLAYVPVSKKLVKGGERLSSLIHAQPENVRVGSPWWTKARNDVFEVYRDAWRCAQGTLLCPTVMSDGNIVGKAALEHSSRTEQFIKRISEAGPLVMEVSYPENPLPEWVPDL